MRVRVIFLLVRRGTGVTGGIERRGWGHRRAPRDVEPPPRRRRIATDAFPVRRRSTSADARARWPSAATAVVTAPSAGGSSAAAVGSQASAAPSPPPSPALLVQPSSAPRTSRLPPAHPELASSCRRVVMSWCRRSVVSVSPARVGRKRASRAARAQCAIIWTDGRVTGVPLSRPRARRDRGRERGQK